MAPAVAAESAKVVLYIRMLFREGELESPSSLRLARRGADGEAWGLQTREGRPDQSIRGHQPSLPASLACKYLRPGQDCEGDLRLSDDK